MKDCNHCRVTAADFAERADWWECSHLECPMRSTVTAAAPDHLEDQSYRGGSVPQGSGIDVGHHGCYRVPPTDREGR